jgi:nucleotide-binding universal stress UspA family protein
MLVTLHRLLYLPLYSALFPLSSDKIRFEGIGWKRAALLGNGRPRHEPIRLAWFFLARRGPFRKATQGALMILRTILLPVDGSAFSLWATDAAADLARLTGARVVLLHCHLAFPLVREGRAYAEVMEELRDISNTLMDPFRTLLAERGVEFTEELREGRPADMIAEAAERLSADIIVMGSRGHSEVGGILLGSVTHRVLHTAPCNVLVIKCGQAGSPSTGPRAGMQDA